MKLYMVRHGSTEWNTEPVRFQGWTDTSLSKKGCAQALAIAEAAKPLDIAMIYSSHLKRAKQTAEIVAERLKVSFSADSRLAEARKGVWEGMTFKAIEKKYPELWSVWLKNPFTARIPDGETVEEALFRFRKAVAEILDNRTDESSQSVLIITHGGIISIIRCLVAKLQLANYHEMIPANGEIFELRKELLFVDNV